VSIEGGIDRAIERALALEATALQVFVGSNRAWRSRELSDAEVVRFRTACARSGLAPATMAHSSYLINLAAPDPVLWRRSIAAFTEELRRCERLEIPYLVVHPGAHCGAGLEAGLDRAARALDASLGAGRRASRFPGVRVLLEITAGQGTSLGHRFEHVAALFERARSVERLGVCFDTCHVLAAGYDFRDGDSYRATIAELDRHIGLDRVLGFHLNDSVHPLGSRRDRHAHIGRGEVGLEGFRRILGDRRFRSIPMVLETPKGRDSRLDRRNLSVLRGLVRAAR
jgi:deoxyribonuclease IV